MAPKKKNSVVSKVGTPTKRSTNNQRLMDTNLDTPTKVKKTKVSPVKTPLKSTKVKNTKVSPVKTPLKSPKVKKTNVSPVKTPLKSPKKTSKIQQSQRTASFRFTDEQKLDILCWYDSTEVLHMDSSDYKKSKRTGMYAEKGKEYKDEEGNVCEPEKLFNFLKRCRKLFTNMTKEFAVSGRGKIEIGRMDPVSQAIYRVYNRQGRSIVRKNRGLKSKTVST